MQSIKTKVLTMFMSFVMAVAMFPALGSNAATLAWTYNNIVYKFNESTGVMTVTGTGEMFNFTALDTNGDKRPEVHQQYPLHHFTLLPKGKMR